MAWFHRRPVLGFVDQALWTCKVSDVPFFPCLPQREDDAILRAHASQGEGPRTDQYVQTTDRPSVDAFIPHPWCACISVHPGCCCPSSVATNLSLNSILFGVHGLEVKLSWF